RPRRLRRRPRPAPRSPGRPIGAGHADCALLIPLEDGCFGYRWIDRLISGDPLADHAHGVRADAAEAGQLKLEEHSGVRLLARNGVTLQHDPCGPAAVALVLQAENRLCTALFLQRVIVTPQGIPLVR